MVSEVEIASTDSDMALGELLGIDVPTRYGPQIHAAVDTALSINSLIAPPVLGMSQRTVLLCRLLTAVITMLHIENDELSFRRRLELKIMIGLVLVSMALQGIVVRRPFERAYLFAFGVVLISNSLMTEIG